MGIQMLGDILSSQGANRYYITYRDKSGKVLFQDSDTDIVSLMGGINIVKTRTLYKDVYDNYDSIEFEDIVEKINIKDIHSIDVLQVILENIYTDKIDLYSQNRDCVNMDNVDSFIDANESRVTEKFTSTPTTVNKEVAATHINCNCCEKEIVPDSTYYVIDNKHRVTICTDCARNILRCLAIHFNAFGPDNKNITR